MMPEIKERRFLRVSFILAIAASGVVLRPEMIFAQSSDAVFAADREQIIEQRLREMEERMKSAVSSDEPAAVNTATQQPPVAAVEPNPVSVNPVRDARQKEQSKKVERAQTAREDKLKIRQVKKMLHDATAVHRAGLQQDARDQLDAIARFLRSEDFPQGQREQFQKQLLKLSRAVDEKAEQQSRRAKAQSSTESDSGAKIKVKATPPVVSAARDSKPVRGAADSLENSRQQAQESLRQLESARQTNARAPAMDSLAGREVVRKKEELADDLRRQREAIIQEQGQAQSKLAKGIQDLYRRGEEHFRRGDLDQALPIFEDLELLSPGYQKTADYLQKIKSQLSRPANGS